MKETDKLNKTQKTEILFGRIMGKESLENSTLIGQIKGKISRRKQWEMYLTRLGGGTCTRK